MKFSDLSIGTRLKGGFAAVLALAVLLAGLAWAQIHHIGGIVTEINDSWMVSVTQLNDMRSTLNEVRRGELRSVLRGDPASLQAEDDARAAAMQRYAVAVKPYEETGISGPPERELYTAFQAALAANQATWQKLRELVRAGEAQRPQAQAFVLGESRIAFEAADKALATLIAFNVRGAGMMRDRSNAALAQADVAVAAGVAVVVLLGAGFAWWLSRSIVRPLHEGIQAARVMAGGDLSQAVTSRSRDEAGQLLAALAAMQHTLRSTITGIQQAAEQVGTASGEIASGNSDLSARTEQQASNLQQTAASIEQLSATVVQGAESARQANQLAASAAEFAARGGQVVGEVVGTMSGISASSRRIADIIGTIDGIAFQTNILALNAAVEAARAGEQGRGFAVVASEVRTLAKRSADAAKEIKSLIQESVDRVGAGSEQVQRAGQTMNDIVGAVRRVADLIGEVSAAAAEQDAGFRQVNTAVTHLDQTTQQNAALVEQSAAAAHSLRDQAQRLTQAVGRFRLGAAT